MLAVLLRILKDTASPEMYEEVMSKVLEHTDVPENLVRPLLEMSRHLSAGDLGDLFTKVGEMADQTGVIQSLLSTFSGEEVLKLLRLGDGKLVPVLLEFVANPDVNVLRKLL
jgi:hypothetical protein